ncbi:MAG: 30S ribosomal protein S17e [Conexivisphaerales archaeon]
MDRVRRIAQLLMEGNPGKFSDDYENNKKVVEEVSKFNTKQLKNRVVGYITHYYKLESREEPEAVNAESGEQPLVPAEAAAAESGSSI